ncbi:hypothetical protein KAH55_10920, partial [bacterium]|nr:hypothetical protein [bacterium]
MKKHLFLVSILLLLAFLNVQAQTVSVALPETLKVAKGEWITIPVTVNGLPETSIFDFDGELQFDEAVLDFQGATCVGTIAQKWGEPIFNSGLDGRAIFGNYANQELTPLTTVGTLILLDFAVVGDFSDTTSLSWAKMNFTRDADVTIDAVPGFVAVNAAPIVVTVTTGMGAGTEAIVDGVTHRAPYSASWAPGDVHSISCPEMQTAGETIRYFFESWSNGGERSHSVTPVETTTYVAALRTEYYCNVQSDFGETSGSGWYAANSEVEISVDSMVVVDDFRRLSFNSWKGAGTGAYSGTERNVSFLLLGPVTQTADFTPQYWLEVTTLPENLTVLLGSGWYNTGDSATTSAAPEMIGGHYFRGWLVDGEGETGNPVSILMDAPHSAVANYAEDVSVIVNTNVGTG